ncbi:hypothetical protein PUN28_019821 [Cardiocondyla obscurior]|uniref:Cytochrome P450 305a1 n=1 Tax=Cardiocondyla obscurior TaxID=286306 RepID=A0AAW2E9R8_9HYME
MITAVTLAILAIFLVTVFMRQKRKSFPGPFPWPFIGNRYYLQKLTRELGGQHIAFHELGRIYNSGIIRLRLGSKDTIVVTDSKLIHEICLNEKYDGRPWNTFIQLRNMGLRKGITMNDGSEWKELRVWSVRALKNVGFAKQAMMDLIVDEMTLILEKLGNGGVRQIRSAIAPAVINVLWMLVTGQKASENLSSLQKFIDMLDRRAQIFDMTGGILSTFPWIRYVAPEMSGYNILVTLNNELKRFLMDTINEHKKRYVKGNEADFIDMFLHEMYNSEEQRDKGVVFSDDNLLVTLIDFFIAGTNNTTSMLDIVFLQMANHQDVQRKLHQEIDAVVGDRFPHPEDRFKMPFTEAILTECQRMWNVTPVIGPRRVLSNTILDGYTIPKNTTILMNLYSNNMDPEVFPDPSSFRPERYINENGDFQPSDNVILFGKGKRRCPGEILAKSAIFLLFIGVMQKYRLLPIPGKRSIEMKLSTGLTLTPKPYEMLLVPK